MPALALETAPPKITLRNAPGSPYDGAIAAARTCYSPRVIEPSEVTERQRDSIGPLTFDGGHHTVFQHAHFEFGMENISRQFVWSVLHGYPFYNSEQSSQRYVKLHEPRAFVPPLGGEALEVYEQAVRARVGCLRAAVRPAERRRVGDSEGAALRAADEQRRAAQRRRARSGEEGDRDGALRHSDRRLHVDGAHGVGSRAASPAPDAERRRHAVRSAAGHRPDGRSRQRGGSAVLREGRSRHAGVRRSCRKRGFPRPARRRRRLRHRVRSPPGRPRLAAARLVRRTPKPSWPTPCDRRSVCRPDEMDGRRRDRSGDESGAQPVSRRHAERVVPLADDARAASRVVRLREASESHGGLAGSAPPHGAGVAAVDDVCGHDGARLRDAAADSPEPRGARRCTSRRCSDAWAAKNRLLALGVPLEFAIYLLPNAKALRLVESGSFIALQHKWTLRTCFNAQEEIYLASMDEIEQVRAGPSAPRRGSSGPPCVLQKPDRVAALHRRHALLRRAGVEQLPDTPSGGSDVSRAPGSRTSTPRSAPWRRCWRRSTCSPGDFRDAFIWLGVADLHRLHRRIAGARACACKERLPFFDGGTLDNIIDYLTYVFIPVLLIIRANLLPEGGCEFCIGSAMLMASALRLQPDRCEGRGGGEHFFTGFPSYWNIVALYLYVWRLEQRCQRRDPARPRRARIRPAAIRVPVAHDDAEAAHDDPGVRRGRAVVSWMVWRLPETDGPWFWLSLVFPIYYVVAVVLARLDIATLTCPLRSSSS